MAACLALVTLIAGVTARSGTLAPILAKPAGVALWCALVYWLVVMRWTRASLLAATLTAIGIGWAVELLQLTPVPAALAAELPLSRWVLGSTFHAMDLGAYVAGAMLAMCAHWALRRAGIWRTDASSLG